MELLPTHNYAVPLPAAAAARLQLSRRSRAGSSGLAAGRPAASRAAGRWPVLRRQLTRAALEQSRLRASARLPKPWGVLGAWIVTASVELSVDIRTVCCAAWMGSLLSTRTLQHNTTNSQIILAHPSAATPA
jgi:hypothetical protein